MRKEKIVFEEYSGDYDEKGLLRYISQLSFSTILDSSLRSNDLGRYTIIGINPFLFFTSKAQKITLDYGGKKKEITGNPLEILRDLLNEYKSFASPKKHPFSGGCIGYFSYDLVLTSSCYSIRIFSC